MSAERELLSAGFAPPPPVVERGIAFTGANVLSVMAGLKTMTRRMCKAAKLHDSGEEYRDDDGWPLFDASIDGCGDVRCLSPWGAAGDRLWIREAYAVAQQYNKLPPRSLKPRGMTVLYTAGGSTSWGETGEWAHDPSYPEAHPAWKGKARPAMFMCRWMTRALLDVVSIKVERLQDISEADARAEGAAPASTSGFSTSELALLPWPLQEGEFPYRNGFAMLWESINGPGSWRRNPWVWCVEFKLSEARP